jgi:hypothetical protein
MAFAGRGFCKPDWLGYCGASHAVVVSLCRALCARFGFLCTVDNFRLLFKIKPFGLFGLSWHLPLYLQRR